MQEARYALIWTLYRILDQEIYDDPIDEYYKMKSWRWDISDQDAFFRPKQREVNGHLRARARVERFERAVYH